jgi:prepilin-type processing-associated H-X9-DG protein
MVVDVFSCPADSRTSSVQYPPDYTYAVALTAYLGVEGTNQDAHDGVLFVDSQIKFANIRDGLSNTLMVGERPPSAHLDLGWWYAGKGLVNTGSGDMDLSVKEINVGTIETAGCPLGTYEYGPGSIQNQCDALHFWSLHPGGGAHFLFCDGSVHFIAYSAASVMRALATRAGGETATIPD